MCKISALSSPGLKGSPSETKSPIPTSPVLFTKCNNALNRHGGVIKLPAHVATQFDYEVELVVVMGKTAWRVSEADALARFPGTEREPSSKEERHSPGSAAAIVTKGR